MRPHPAEFRERAVQLAVEHLGGDRGPTAAEGDIARKLGCAADSLRVRCEQAPRDTGRAAGPISAE